MKKIIIILSVVIALIAAGIWYVASQTDNLIRQQVQLQGSQYLGTSVTLQNAELSMKNGRLVLTGLAVQNPAGFSDQKAISAQGITLDLGAPRGDAYVVQQFALDAPSILYEADSSGGSNLQTIQRQLQANLPKAQAQDSSKSAQLPLVIIDDVVISATQLSLDFGALPAQQLGIDKTAYSLTLPTFSLGAIGQPNGIPAEQVGSAVTDALIDEIKRIAKAEAKKAAKDAAKEKLNEELDKQKDKLKDKMKDKLKDLIGG